MIFMDDLKQQRTILFIFLSLAGVVGLLTGAVGGALSVLSLSDSAWLREKIKFESTTEQQIVNLMQEESATIDVVEHVTPAVVSIIVKKRLSDLPTATFPFLDDVSFFSSSKGSISESDPLVEIGGGTGFFITTDGLLVTNRHVVEDEKAQYTVMTNDGKEYVAEIVDLDPFYDIAVLKVLNQTFPTVVFGHADSIRIGQTVIAIGNTLSEYRNTVTKGVVSGINRRVSAYDFTRGGEIIEGAIQTDAAINPGNSGGPLINLKGEVIGMNTAISAEGEGVGFAIPIEEVKQVVISVERFGHIVRPWLGVRFVMVTETMAEEQHLPVDQGAWLVPDEKTSDPAVIPKSPADIAGLKSGDIILRVNEKELDEEYTLADAIRTLEAGDAVMITVQRGEEIFDVQVTLTEFIDEEQKL
ncbi:MAG: Protease Do [Candidatus Uhrbacteria bacterium GW2011_GWC2_41_11]|uniref:Protease Do n=1 Tax=Candidatus Uhrbacteria bacterium GW2011_GWC2_41_11 TaxID=1618985 RepID=A0A0G0UJX9_9BACT|nr:MAG: Protease Do [Candidatus Uhrbacteria bacterium GW2011_GWC2_41_11]HBP00382.1 hypothetical protein [Candidatus Uhrbacteria bacterium]